MSNSSNRFSRRNNSNKIVQQRFKTSLRKNSFAVRVAKVWYKLPDQVINASSTNAFQNRLDKYWENEELYYSDYRAEISGGNRNDIKLPDIDTIVTISKDLTWKAHINNITNKANKTLGFIKRNIHGCTQKVKQHTFTTMVRPTMEYASIC